MLPISKAVLPKIISELSKSNELVMIPNHEREAIDIIFVAEDRTDRTVVRMCSESICRFMKSPINGCMNPRTVFCNSTTNVIGHQGIKPIVIIGTASNAIIAIIQARSENRWLIAYAL